MSSISEKLESLLGELPTKIYNNLHEHLGISKTKLTQFLNNPEQKGTAEIVKDLSSLTGLECTKLILTYRIGADNITVKAFEDMKAAEVKSNTDLLTQSEK